ncbi:hypothetical protein GCM10027517_02480 [Phycicoccus ginsengisoli]
MGTTSTLIRPARRSASPRIRVWSGVWAPVVAFILVRLLDALAFTVGARTQFALDSGKWVPRVGSDPSYFIYRDSPASPGYWTVVTNWDGQWYWKIAQEGLHSGAGASPVDLWAWAFGPLFPLTVGAVMDATGLSFPVAMTVVNLTCSLAGVLLLWDLVRRRAGSWWAACAVALFLCFPSGALFQAGYSEAMGLALLMGALWLLDRRLYWWALLPVVALAYTRIVTPPIALVALVHMVVTWRRRSIMPARPSQVAGLGAVAAASVAGAYLWSWTAAIVGGAGTGAVERASNVAGAPQTSWLLGSHEKLGPLGVLAMAGLLVVLAMTATTATSRLLGLELRTWLVAYPLFVLAVTPVTTGIIRYLVLCPPIAMLPLLVAPPHDRRRLGIITAVACAVMLSGQWWYATHALVLSLHGAMMP